MYICTNFQARQRIYLFDEPFNGLDLETNKILKLIILALKNKGKTIFISSHIINPLYTVCVEIIYIEKGKFINRFEKNDFGKIEELLFNKLKEETGDIILKSL